MGKEQIFTNVLIAGKSGAGKSSLLNYIFGCKHQETGAGKPITQKGLYPFDYHYDEELWIRIYDTWGLEADKSGEWKELIMEEIQRHDKKSVSEWFNTIIYCLNSNAQLVEDFEIDYMREILAQKNHIVVVITQCKNGQGEMKDHRMTKRLVSEIGISEDKIIYVNSVSEATIGGKAEPQFGKEKIFCAILQNLWDSLRTKVPYIMEQRMRESFLRVREDLKQYVDVQRILFRKDKKLEEIAVKVNKVFINKIDEIAREANHNFEEAVEYYNRLSQKYASIILMETKKIKFGVGKYSPEDEFKNEVKLVLDNIISQKKAVGKLLGKMTENENVKNHITEFLVATKKYITSSRKLKWDLKRLIDEQATNIMLCMLQELRNVEMQLYSINVDEMYLHQMNGSRINKK